MTESYLDRDTAGQLTESELERMLAVSLCKSCWCSTKTFNGNCAKCNTPKPPSRNDHLSVGLDDEHIRAERPGDATPA